MALFYCPECSASVSELASSCPKCGRTFTKEIIAQSLARKKTLEQICAVVFVAFVLFIFFGVASGNGTDRPNKSPNADWSSSGSGKVGPVTRAQLIVKQALKCRTTASFPWSMDEYDVMGFDTDWTVSGYVDSQNGFGAKVRTNWKVEFVNSPNGDLDRIEDLSFE